MSNYPAKECVVVATKDALLELCRKYRIPSEDIESDAPDPNGTVQHKYIVSKDGARECGADCPSGSNVFESIKALRQHLFKQNLLGGKIVVYKRTYRTYLKTVRLLKKLRIKAIKDRTYFEGAYCFYVRYGTFKELDLFGCKVIVSMTNGIQFKGEEFFRELKVLVKNRRE